MTDFSLGRMADSLLSLLEAFDPLLAPYRRFHERLPAKVRHTITAFLFILPFGILYAIFTILPIFQTFYISLHRWEIMGTNIRYIGLRNFERLLTRDTQFQQAFEQTIIFVALTIPIIFVGLGFALMLNRPVRGIGIFRTIFYLPNIMAVTVIGLIWARVFASSDRGLINAALENMGLQIIPFLDRGDLATLVVAFTTLWWTVGFSMLIFLAGLQDIPQSLYDAAKVDGANRRRQFLHITLPGLRRPFAFLSVLQVIASFQIFGQVDVMTGGGPAGNTRTIVYNIYETTFLYFQVGYGTAMAVIMFAVLLVISILQLTLFRDQGVGS
ncbi:MAG: sugar ABC transporter permease [Chloroflexi bacterium]|nr:sugar ABC transporter permease [Chloroflexota bacterium]MCY4247528.1 sugar ABC transporter permease [Chloroflexota bacterium]